MTSSPGPADTWEYHSDEQASGERHPTPAAVVQVNPAGRSHRGRVRPNNEDHFLVARAGRYLRTVATNLPAGSLPEEFDEGGCALAVADGLGGMAAGEVASRLAITRFVELVLRTPDWIFGVGQPEIDRIVERAENRVREVSADVAAEAHENPRLAGMGSTLTLAWNVGATLFVVHVGDSRVYLYRNSRLHKLTREHTLAEDLIDRGAFPDAQSAPVRLRHILTRAIGGPSGECDPDIRSILLEHGDRLLLCTDGLTDMLDEPAIADLLEACPDASEACRRLVDQALEQGGKDNVTVLVADYAFSAP